MREMRRTDTRARYNRDELYLLTDLLVQLDFVYVYKLFFFVHYYSKAFIFYSTSTIDSSLFSNSVRVIIALKRSKPIYKTNCSDSHRPLFICVCTRTADHLKYSIIPWMCSRRYFYTFKPHKLNYFPLATGFWHTQVLLCAYVKYLSYLTWL